MIYDKHPALGNKFERDFWAFGYYVYTNENVDEATIRKYTREQEEESYKEACASKQPLQEVARDGLLILCLQELPLIGAISNTT